jgi:hypothetical protein
MFYKLLGMFVWKAMRYYVRSRVSTAKKIGTASIVGVLVLALLAGGSKRLSA